MVVMGTLGGPLVFCEICEKEDGPAWLILMDSVVKWAGVVFMIEVLSTGGMDGLGCWNW